MASLSLRNVCKIYDKDVMAVDRVNLEIEDKEFIVLVGPSGCGKSTTLRMIAGLEDITSGEIDIDGVTVNELDPKDRDIAMVFQNYALYPHMTVYKNMSYALRIQKVKKDEIDRRVKEAAEILNITELLNRTPKALSGGQRQRVAIGRAIVRNPKVFLMDEPLSNLDAKLRNQMRAELIKLHKKLSTTFIYVTHDQMEAITLGTRIVVMKDGVVQQVDEPRLIMDRPANMFVAGFIGTPQINFLQNAKLEEENGNYIVKWRDRIIVLDEEKQQILRKKRQRPCTVTLGIRPADMQIAQAGENTFPAKIDITEFIGTEMYLHIQLNGSDGADTVLSVDRDFDISQKEIFIAFNEKKLHLFNQEKENNILFET